MSVTRLTKSQRQRWSKKATCTSKMSFPATKVPDISMRQTNASNAMKKKTPASVSLTIIQTLVRTSRIDPLMDHPNLFPIIIHLMGPYLQIMGSQICVRYPSDSVRDGRLGIKCDHRSSSGPRGITRWAVVLF